MPKYVEKLTKYFAIAKNFIKLNFFDFEEQISECRYLVVDFHFKNIFQHFSKVFISNRPYILIVFDNSHLT